MARRSTCCQCTSATTGQGPEPVVHGRGAAGQQAAGSGPRLQCRPGVSERAHLRTQSRIFSRAFSTAASARSSEAVSRTFSRLRAHAWEWKEAAGYHMVLLQLWCTLHACVVAGGCCLSATQPAVPVHSAQQSLFEGPGGPTPGVVVHASDMPLPTPLPAVACACLRCMGPPTWRPSTRLPSRPPAGAPRA